LGGRGDGSKGYGALPVLGGVRSCEHRLCVASGSYSPTQLVGRPARGGQVFGDLRGEAGVVPGGQRVRDAA
jgi:hypothetical protein